MSFRSKYLIKLLTFFSNILEFLVDQMVFLTLKIDIKIKELIDREDE